VAKPLFLRVLKETRKQNTTKKTQQNLLNPKGEMGEEQRQATKRKLIWLTYLLGNVHLSN
jgi:hypothetical protein